MGGIPEWVKYAVAVVAVVVLGVMAYLVFLKDDAPEGSDEPACQQFETVAEQRKAGDLDNEQLVAEFQEINEKAQSASDELIAGSEELVTAFTSGTEADQSQALQKFGSLCRQGA